MVKKIIYFFSFFLVLGSVILFWLVNIKDKQIEKKEHTVNISGIDTGFDKKIEDENNISWYIFDFSWNTIKNYNLASLTGIYIDLNFSWVSKREVIKKIKDFYFKSLIQGDVIGQIQALIYLYNFTKDKKILPIIASKLEKQYMFDNAIYYRKLYYSWDFKNLDKYFFKKLIYVFINSDKYFNVDLIKKLVENWYLKWLLSSDEKNFYESIFLALDLDLTWFIQKVQVLSGKDKFKTKILEDYKLFRQYRDVAWYYFWWLVAKDFFDFWYIWPARIISLKILQYNPNYILPNQILAYVFFLQNDKRWIKYLKKLMDIDSSNQLYYKFLLWVLNYWLWKYSDCIVYLYWIPKNFDYEKNVYRYLFLSYYKLWDYSKSFNFFKQLEKNFILSSYDFWTFFNLFLFNRNNDIKSIVKIHKKDILETIIRCYKSLSPTLYYICRYWKWLYYFRFWYTEKALKYIKYLVKYYPEPQFFAFLWKWYENKNKLDLAERYYLMGLKYSISDKYVKFFRWKIIDLLIKGNSK